MHFSSSYYLQVIYRTGFLPPFFDLHVIYRLPFSIYMLFTGSLFPFTCYLQAPFFDLHVLYGLLFCFPCYLQTPFFDLHVIYRLPFSIYMLFTGSLFRFTCSLWAPFLTRELRACARASCSYDGKNGTRSLARLVDSCKLFSILGFCVHLIAFGE